MTFVFLLMLLAVILIAISMQDFLKRSYTEGKVREFKLTEKVDKLISQIKNPDVDEVRAFGYFGFFQDQLKEIFIELRNSINSTLIDRDYIDELEHKFGRKLYEELERDFRKREFEK